MFVCCECCVLSGRSLCDELITSPEESYRLWCVVLCDLETSRMRRQWPALGPAVQKKYIISYDSMTMVTRKRLKLRLEADCRSCLETAVVLLKYFQIRSGNWKHYKLDFIKLFRNLIFSESCKGSDLDSCKVSTHFEYLQWSQPHQSASSNACQSSSHK